MSPATKDLILEHLRIIDATLDKHSEDFREVNTRLGILEQQFGSVSHRLDRMDDRLSRIETRLHFVEA
jgi:archaellum component FlaC